MNIDNQNLEPNALMEHRKFLQGIARGLLSDKDMADDLLQDTWLVAQRSKRGPHSLAWLAGVLRNLAYKRHRSEERRKARELRSARKEGYEPAESILETQGRVLEAVRELPEPYQTSIVLRYYHDLTPNEIARQLDEPVQTIKTRLRRGLKRMRARLDDQDAYFAIGWVVGLRPVIEALPLHALSGGAIEIAKDAVVPKATRAGLAKTAWFSPSVVGAFVVSKLILGLVASLVAVLVWMSLRDDAKSAPSEVGHPMPVLVSTASQLQESAGETSELRVTVDAKLRDPTPEEVLAELRRLKPELPIEPVVQLHLSSSNRAPLPIDFTVKVTPYLEDSMIPGQSVETRSRWTGGPIEIPLGMEAMESAFAHGIVELRAKGFGRQKTDLVEIGWGAGDVSQVTLELSPCTTIDVVAVHEGTEELVRGAIFILKGPSARFGSTFRSRQGGIIPLNLAPPGVAEDFLCVSGEGAALGCWTTRELLALPINNEGVRRLELFSGCTLRGLIETELGLPVPANSEVRYVLRRDPGSGLMEYPHGVAPQGQVTIAEDGTFEIPDLPTGTLLIHLREKSRDIRAPQITPDYRVEVPRRAEFEYQLVVPAEREALALNISWGNDQTLLFADLYRPAGEHDKPYGQYQGPRELIAQEHWFTSGVDTHMILPTGTLKKSGLYILRVGHGIDRRIERFVRIQGNTPYLQHTFNEAERAEYPAPINGFLSAGAPTFVQQRAAREAGAQVVLEAKAW